MYARFIVNTSRRLGLGPGEGRAFASASESLVPAPWHQHYLEDY